jgi:transposase
MGHDKRKKAAAVEPPAVRSDAAGIDISPEVMFVAVDPRRDPKPVREFGAFTVDLYRIANWLKACGVRSVAMESTGVYWIPLYQVLEERGFEVCLVNARDYQNVPGRKTDVLDCQWLQYLHAVGLLRASFRPEQEICAVRSLLRHRKSLVEAASKHVQHMQKALDQMNIQIHRVLSDLTGRSGLAILDAILEGQRDPAELAKLRDGRVKASEATIQKALQGDYREEHLFTLRQSLESYRHYLRLMADCDRKILTQLEAMAQRFPEEKPPDPPPSKPLRPGDGEDLRQLHYRILGVDLTRIPAISTATVQTILSEVGPNLSKFRSAHAFAAWSGLCPNQNISGGKVLSSRTRKVVNRVAVALRMAAESLCRDKSHLGHYYRRLRARIGPAQAVTAAAHKLARIIYHFITTREAYDEGVFQAIEQRHAERLKQRLQKQARMLGYPLTPRAVLGTGVS